MKKHTNGIKIKQIKKQSLPIKKQFFTNQFGDQKKEIFYYDLGILLQSGIDIKSAFDLIIQQFDSKQIAIIRNLQEKIIRGMSLADAMESSDTFTPYEFHSIHIGEEIGQLDRILIGLSEYFKKKVSQKRQLIQALTYPLVVLLTSFAAIFFMLNFVVPMFADIFTRSGNDLPTITKIILNVSTWVKSFFPIALLLISSIFSWAYYRRHQTWNRKWTSWILFKTPLLGDTFRKLALARFCNAMALLSSAQVPLNRSLDLCIKMVASYPLEQSLIGVRKKIIRGEALHISLTDYPIYDAKMISLIRVGEEINQLPQFFDRLATQYQDEVSHRSANIASVLEPFLILILGAFVGFILIAMYLPMFQIGSTLD